MVLVVLGAHVPRSVVPSRVTGLVSGSFLLPVAVVLPLLLGGGAPGVTVPVGGSHPQVGFTPANWILTMV